MGIDYLDQCPFFSYEGFKIMSNFSKFNKNKMIYIFVSEDGKVVLPFQGSEQEMLDYWDILAERGMRINRIEHQYIHTTENNPYTPLL